MSVKKLTGKQKRYLKGLGHSMKPLVNIGKNGLTDPLIEQVQQCLLTHELVKVKILESCSLEKKECSIQLGEKAKAHVTQVIGRTILLYSPHPEEPVINLPKS